MNKVIVENGTINLNGRTYVNADSISTNVVIEVAICDPYGSVRDRIFCKDLYLTTNNEANECIIIVVGSSTTDVYTINLLEESVCIFNRRLIEEDPVGSIITIQSERSVCDEMPDASE